MVSSFKFFHVVCFLFLSVTLAFAKDGSREYWIDRYLSVSYPLKTIKVNSRFGSRKDPFTGERSTHSGLDLQANYEDVYCMFDGQVEKIGSDNRSGHYITIRHGEYTISYCHLSKVTAKEGENLIAGDVVAVSGNTGRSTGPHLHITCKYKGILTDPYTLLIYIKQVREEASAALGVHTDNVNWTRTVTKSDCKAFFERYAPAAMHQQQLYGIPSSVTLSQMALESGWGLSTLARNGNNFFGIKCSKQWLAEGKPYSLHNDDKPNEKFCNYSSVMESITHHSKLLMSERYKRCRNYGPTDYHNWLVSIIQAGYASNKNYVQNCEKLIKQYDLHLYDQIALKQV